MGFGTPTRPDPMGEEESAAASDVTQMPRIRMLHGNQWLQNHKQKQTETLVPCII